jgi:ribosomal protein L11 methyltransferase
MKNFIEINIPLKGFQTDELSGILHLEGCLGIHEMNQNEWRLYFNNDWTPDHSQNLFLQLNELNPNLKKDDLIISEIPSSDWNTEWKKYFKPIEPVKNIWIRPPWEKFPDHAKGIELIIDPQMAFGTGHHETTALMIKLMSQSSLKNLDVLDVGTGSGILAILADKLGAHSVLAIDNDSDAIANTKHNLKLNRVSNVRAICQNIQSFTDSDFSLILANINFEILTFHIEKLKNLLKKQGKMIISGILSEETEQIKPIYVSNGLQLTQEIELGEWAGMVWENT